MEIFSMIMDDGITLKGRYWPADNEIAVIQIVHGASEYSKRYTSVAEWLAEHGVSVYALDNRGHGLNQTPSTKEVYLEAGDGYRMPHDVIALGERIRADHPGKPFALLGHSMGSFIARVAAGLPNPYDKYIFSGTGFRDAFAVAGGKFLAKGVRLFKGDRSRSKLLDNMTFQNMRDDMKKKGIIKEDHEWLTSDVEHGDINRDDKVLGQKFTVGAYQAMVDLVGQSQDLAILKNTTKPVLILTGLLDPVGDYGRSVKKLARRLRKYGQGVVKENYYPNMRHEVLNEKDRLLVYQDVLDFIME